MSGGDEIENESENNEVTKSIHIHYHYHYQHAQHQSVQQPPQHQPPPPSVQSWALSTDTVKIFCRANEHYNLVVRIDVVVLAPANRNDPFQHWIRYDSTIKDKKGSLAFALVNKATGLAIKHSFGHDHPARLVPHNSDYLDESVLWTETMDKGHGFRGIRMVNNIHLHFDAMRGDQRNERIRDGTGLLIFKWSKGVNHNQHWKILPWCKLN